MRTRKPKDTTDLFHSPASATTSHPCCDRCKEGLAEIFQDNGDYCLECWQELTHPMT